MQLGLAIRNVSVSRRQVVETWVGNHAEVPGSSPSAYGIYLFEARHLLRYTETVNQPEAWVQIPEVAIIVIHIRIIFDSGQN